MDSSLTNSWIQSHLGPGNQQNVSTCTAIENVALRLFLQCLENLKPEMHKVPHEENKVL